jgi:hypothetical protein
MQRVRDAVRAVIARTGCELAAALLTQQLRREGFSAGLVRRRYLAPEEERDMKNLHGWVELEGLLLDPTRDQYGQRIPSAGPTSASASMPA